MQPQNLETNSQVHCQFRAVCRGETMRPVESNSRKTKRADQLQQLPSTKEDSLELELHKLETGCELPTQATGL